MVETFDADGLAALLDAIRQPRSASVWAPAYSREQHEPAPFAIEVSPSVGLVIVEGNWLGLDAEAWLAVRAHLDALWFLDVPWEVCRERLVARRLAVSNQSFGRLFISAIQADVLLMSSQQNR